MPDKASRPRSFATVLIVYIIAFAAFSLVYRLTFRDSILLSTFWGDIAATILVCFFGILYRNSSLYDPYWSVAPLVIVPFWIGLRPDPLHTADILFLATVFFWGTRLTLNWAVRWSGLHHQDWRYTRLKENHPRLWPLVNLAGINLMPTVLVFMGLIPVYAGIFHRSSPNFLLWAGFLVCTGAAAIQHGADKQMDAFKKRSLSGRENIDEGLWRYSRHPNYFGEILFWWGLWIMQMGVNPAIVITVAGPVLITLLFIFISIPMMEKHNLTSRPAYADYQKDVPALVPWFRKKQGTKMRHEE